MKKLCLAAILVSAMLFVGCTKAQNDPTEQVSQTSTESSAGKHEEGSQETTVVQSEENLTSELQTSDSAQQEAVRLAALKGPTSMGMVKLLEDDAKKQYAFTLASSPDEIVPKLLKSELDIAAVPANLASVLYNKSEGKIKVLAINTLGVLYIVEKGGESIQTVEDLKGKTILAGGQGATPEFILLYLLKQHNLTVGEDVQIEWKSEHTEIVSAMAAKDQAIALLPQPFVTVAQTQAEGIRTALDLTKEWENTEAGGQLITGVLVARADFIEKNPEAISTFCTEYKKSTEWVNANTAEAAKLIGAMDIVKEQVAAKALPFCNITYIDKEEMKTQLSRYLEILFQSSAEAVGGKLPEDAFYFVSP